MREQHDIGFALETILDVSGSGFREHLAGQILRGVEDCDGGRRHHRPHICAIPDQLLQAARERDGIDGSRDHGTCPLGTKLLDLIIFLESFPATATLNARLRARAACSRPLATPRMNSRSLSCANARVLCRPGCEGPLQARRHRTRRRLAIERRKRDRPRQSFGLLLRNRRRGLQECRERRRRSEARKGAANTASASHIACAPPAMACPAAQKTYRSQEAGAMAGSVGRPTVRLMLRQRERE